MTTVHLIEDPERRRAEATIDTPEIGTAVVEVTEWSSRPHYDMDTADMVEVQLTLLVRRGDLTVSRAGE